MATQAEMLARIAAYPGDTTGITLGEVKQDDTTYWIVGGSYKLPGRDGTPAVEIEVSFQEIKT